MKEVEMKDENPKTEVGDSELGKSRSTPERNRVMRRMVSSKSLSWAATSSSSPANLPSSSPSPSVVVEISPVNNHPHDDMVTSSDRVTPVRAPSRTRSSTRWGLDVLRFIDRTKSGSLERMTRFDKHAEDGLLSRDNFAQCIGMEKSKEFAETIFDVLTRRKQPTLIDKINKDEFLQFWERLSNPSFDARLQIFFDMADSNGDGKIDRDEIQELITLSASATGLNVLTEKAPEYANLIMEALGPGDNNAIELPQLERLLLQGGSYRGQTKPASLTWSQKIKSVRLNDILQRLKWLIINNWRRGWLILVWMMAVGALFAWKFTQYRNKAAFQIMGYCLCTAKGAAETLKLNMALILLPMCRNTLTFFRSTWTRLFLPFNDNLNFHKMIGLAIVIGIVLHAGNHLACDFPRLVNSSPEKFKLIASDFNYRQPTYVGLLTGVEGITGIVMIVLMLISFTLAIIPIRRRLAGLSSPFNRLGSYNAFWYSHHLLGFVYVLLIVHGTFLFLAHKWYQKTTWMYIAFPIILMILERAFSKYRSKYYSVDVLEVSNLPGNVFSVTIQKPESLKYRSGQYIYIHCPAISKFEWHPFSLTSAPDDDFLSVHIQAAGDWTRQLKQILSPQSLDPNGTPKLLIDGPYGAPAQDYKNYDVLLLVGLGIGATPFISILRDILNHDKSETRTESMRVTSAHFYWVTKEYESLEWFKALMNQVADTDEKGLIDMHTYLTSVYEACDVRSISIAMIRDLQLKESGIDILSGTKVKTHFGRPNWKEVFERVANQHPQCTIGVFYCGNMALAKDLKKLAHEMCRTTATRFKFHKEQF